MPPTIKKKWWLCSLFFLSFMAVKFVILHPEGSLFYPGKPREPTGFLSGWWDTASPLKTLSLFPTIVVEHFNQRMGSRTRNQDPWLGIIRDGGHRCSSPSAWLWSSLNPGVGPALMQATVGREWLAGQGPGCVSPRWAFCSATPSHSDMTVQHRLLRRTHMGQELFCVGLIVVNEWLILRWRSSVCFVCLSVCL